MTHAEQLAHSRNIDIALSVLDIIREPSQSLTFDEIAEICGCTATCIMQIERKALAKLRQQSGILSEFYNNDLLPPESNSLNSLSGANQ